MKEYIDKLKRDFPSLCFRDYNGFICIYWNDENEWITLYEDTSIMYFDDISAKIIKFEEAYNTIKMGTRFINFK